MIILGSCEIFLFVVIWIGRLWGISGEGVKKICEKIVVVVEW